MTQIQLSLPDETTRYIEQQVSSGRFQSPSEFVAALVEEARVKAAQEKLAALVREGMESGECIEYSDEWWEQRGDEIRNLAKQRGFA